MFRDLQYNEKVLLERGMMEVRSKITIRKEASNWTFTIFLDKPVKWTYFWNCKLISVNEYNTIWTFGPMPWTKHVKPGQKISLGFNGKFENDGERPQTVTKSFVGKHSPAGRVNCSHNLANKMVRPKRMNAAREEEIAQPFVPIQE
eukprot:sb/3473866/